MLCRPLSQINLTMQPGPVSEGRLGCVLAVWGWGERRVLPSAFLPPCPHPRAESKSFAFCRVSFPLPEHVEPAPREMFDKQEAE